MAILLGLLGPGLTAWLSHALVPEDWWWLFSELTPFFGRVLGDAVPGLGLLPSLHVDGDVQVFLWALAGAVLPSVLLLLRAVRQHGARQRAFTRELGVMVDLIRGQDPHGESEAQAAARRYLERCERSGQRRPGQPLR